MNNENKHINNDLLTRFLAGESTPEERDSIKQWKDASTENRAMFDELQKTWLAMDKTMLHQHINVDAEWKLHLKKYNLNFTKPTLIISMNPALRAAASIILIVCLFYMGWTLYSKKTIRTNLTETIEVMLPDGSKVTINAGTKLKYPHNFHKEQRIVVLEGEAFFEVRKNSKAPFIILLDGAEVKVLGTSFNVKAFKNQKNIEVIVAEGKVSLYEHGVEQTKVIISKGEKATFTKSSKIAQKQQNENRNFIAWKTHSIIFENDSLTDIVNTLSNVYHKEFVIQGTNLQHCTITTSFVNKKLPDVIKILTETLNIVVEERDGKIYISGKGC